MSSGESKVHANLLRELEQEDHKSTLSGVFFFQAVAERSGLNPTDLLGVALLSSRGPLTAGGLAEAMRLTTGAVTGVVNRLERAGYVRRAPDPTDGRRVIVAPVAEALERVGAGFLSPPQSTIATLLAPYSDHDLAVLLDFMRRANAFTEAEIARLRAASEGGENEFSAPLGTVTHGRLVFANGASRLILRADPELSNLYRAHFEGNVPNVEVEGGTVTVSRSRRFPLFDLRKHAETVTLNPAVPWAVEVRSGAARIDTDLRAATLSAFVLRGGVADVTLALPRPVGTVAIDLRGGMSSVALGLPPGTEARVTVRGGVGALTFGEQSFGGVGGKLSYGSPGFGSATDRYEISISGGVGTITVR